MIDEINRNLKRAKVMSIIMGSAYVGIAALVLIIIGVQRLILLIPPAIERDGYNVMHIIFLIFGALTIGLGVLYILLGKKANQLKGKIEKRSYLLVAYSLLIACILIVMNFTVNPGLPHNLGNGTFVEKIMIVFIHLYWGVIIIACFTIPQYLIIKRIRRYKKETEND